jgi:hypothetical protein
LHVPEAPLSVVEGVVHWAQTLFVLVATHSCTVL